MGPNQEFIASRQWSRGLQIGPLGRFSGWYLDLEQWAPKQQNSSLSSRGKIQHQGVESLNLTRAQEKKPNLCMFLNKLNSYKVTYFGPLLSFFVIMYQVILNQTLNNGKIEKSPRKNGKEEPKTQETRGKRMKNVPKTPRSERHLCFSHYSNYQYFPLLFSISIPISISKFPKISISISKSIH